MVCLHLQEEEEGIGDVDLFTLTEDRTKLVVNVKWLQHLQVCLLIIAFCFHLVHTNLCALREPVQGGAAHLLFANVVSFAHVSHRLGK